MTLTEEHRSCLRWMAVCNADKVGFLGPSLQRSGPVDECEEMVRQGFARRHDAPLRWTGEKGKRWFDAGYWITPDGLSALGRQP